MRARAHQLVASFWSNVYVRPARSLSFGATPEHPSTSYWPHSEAKLFHLSLIVLADVRSHSVPYMMAAGTRARRESIAMAVSETSGYLCGRRFSFLREGALLEAPHGYGFISETFRFWAPATRNILFWPTDTSFIRDQPWDHGKLHPTTQPADPTALVAWGRLPADLRRSEVC